MKKMLKRLCCLLLIACVLLQVIPLSVFAEEEKPEESIGEEASDALTTGAADRYKDVRSGDWYYDAVSYVTEKNIFNGTSENTFTPDGTMTRTMAVTVLARMAGVDPEDFDGEPPFKDVEAGSWYAPAVIWAEKYGVVNGTGKGKFSPELNITHQEMAVIFVRYFTIFGVSPGEELVNESEPKDFSEAADWAREAILYLWQRGIVCGDETGAFRPENDMTRAECATLCMRIHKVVDKWKAAPGENPWDPIDPDGKETYQVAFYSENGGYITTMKAKKGSGLGADRVPYHADPDFDSENYFWGWFFTDKDDGKVHLFNTLYPYNEDMEVYAVCGTRTEITEYLEDECYIIEKPVATDYTVTIRPRTPEAEFDPDYDLAVYANEYDRRITYTVEKQANGDYIIRIDGYKPGVYYTMVLNEDFIFLNEETGQPLDELVRYIEFHIEKPVNTELRFRDGIVWLPTSEAKYYSQMGEDPGFGGLGNTEGFGVEREADDTETELGKSIFTFNPETCEYQYEKGTVICVYSDDEVTLQDAEGKSVKVKRLAPNVRDYDEAAYEGLGYSYADLYDGVNDAFYIVTDVYQATEFRVCCDYRELNSDEINLILYVPDVIPYMVGELPEETTGTIENYAAYDTEMYAGYSGDKKPEPKVGDFVTVYTSDLRYYGEQDFKAIRNGEYKGEIPYVYGEITAVDGMKLTYRTVTADEVVSAMNYIDDYYVERYIPKNLLPEVTDEDLADFTEQTQKLLDEETIRAFVTTAIEEDAEQGGEEAQQALEILRDNEISISPEVRGATRIGGEYADDTKKIQVTGKQVAIDIDTSRLVYLPNTDGSWRLSLNLGMMLIVKLRLREGVNLYYTISGNFTQEIAVGLSASGRFDVKWYLCVPVPKHVEFSLSAISDIATDVTLDIRHYTIDKSHMGKQSLYGRQADSQEMWENFQDFLLSPRFVAHGAALYKLEAEYYALVNEALAIDKDDASKRDAAELAVRLKAKEINALWTDGQYGLDQAWERYYLDGGSIEWSEMQTKAAKKAAFDAKDELLANVVNITQRMGCIGKLVDKFTTDSASNVEGAMTELADLNEDGTETEEWKKAQQELEAAKQALKDRRAEVRQLTETAYTVCDQILRDALGYLNAAKATVEMLHNSAVKENNTAAINSTQTVLDMVNSAIGTISVSRRLIAAFKHVVEAVNSVIKMASGDCGDGCEVVAEIYNLTRVLSLALKDCRSVLADLQTNFFTDKQSEEYKNCQDGIEKINNFTDISDVVLEYFHILAVILSDNPAPGQTTDGITDVPTSSRYWKFRAIRTADFQEFSLNTEILDRLNTPDDGLDEENIKQIASKYAEMCAITNTWMDLYRKEIGSTDVPIFPGLDATIGADFVVQANINVAANFNFHVEYGKEFRVKVDILDWDIDFDCLDHSNQKLSVSVIAMGTLGFRAGFEVKLGLKIIKIFTVSTTVEIMPYINLYAYVFFQYNRDLSSGSSEVKLKGAMYIDIGIHIGFNLALKMDILVYKNTWKWNLWNKNISLVDIGERRNVYNFGYDQPQIADIEGKSGDVETAVKGSEEDKGKLNTRPDGLLIVNSATDYKLPAAARNMGYMDMTNGSLGKSAFDAGHYEYKFFTVPKAYDGTTYEVANNLPLYNQMKEVVLTDENGNIVYEENDGAGLPATITLDIDHSDFEEKYIMATNEGTPVMTQEPTGKVLIDIDGINNGRYVEDKRFTADKNGKISFTPETGATGGIYAQDVYVFIEWQEGALEVSNYPVRRIVHILWTNENPITWLNFEVTMVERNHLTDEEEEYVVWSDTAVRGYDTVFIPPLSTVLDGVDEKQMIYDRDRTTYVGAANNDGTLIHYPQNGVNYYITTELKEYSLDIYGLDKDGNDIKKTLTEEYGYSFPIDEMTLPSEVTAKDAAGNPKFLQLAGYRPLQNNDGTEEPWTGVWENAAEDEQNMWRHPIDLPMALDLTDENIPRYLRAYYEDETVKAVFTFVGTEHEQITQYLRRGDAPDLSAVNAEIQALQEKAAAEGRTLNITWSENTAPQRSDKEYLIFCNVSFIAPPKVEQLGSGDEVRIIADTTGAEVDADDTILYGYAVQSEDIFIHWLPDGTDVAQVEQGTEYAFFACLIDGQTMERAYSSETLFTPTGEREDVGYQTVLTLQSYEANPIYPLTVTFTVLYTTGLMSEPITVTLEPGDTADTVLLYDGSPEKIAGLMLTATDEDGEMPEYDYRIYAFGNSSKGTEKWSSDIAYLYFGEDNDSANAKLTFVKN